MRTLWAWKAAIELRLATLRLVMQPGAHPRPATEGIPFLGFVVFPDRTRPKGRKVTHFARRLRRQLRCIDEGTMAPADLGASVTSWLAHAAHGDTAGLQSALLGRHGIDLRELRSERPSR